MRIRLTAILSFFLFVSVGFGHGINGHINVTQWSLKDNDSIAEWRTPGCRNAMVFGSAFPDTGYAVSHAYGEITHWTPFLTAFIDWVSLNQPDDPLIRCFLVGLAVHGLQDEIFDTFFLEQAEHFDGIGQDVVDPGLDAIMVVDGVAEARPEIYVPTDELVSLLSSSFGVEVSPTVIEEGARRVKLAVIDHFGPIAENYAQEHRSSLTWSEANYLDALVVGSLGSEVEPTRAYAEAVWARLNASVVSQDVVSAFEGQSIAPEVNGGKLVYGLVLSRGVSVASIRGGIQARLLSGGAIEYFQIMPGRWTQSDDSFTRVLRLEVSDGRSIDQYEFAASDEWIWADGSPTIGDWFTLTSITEVEPNGRHENHGDESGGEVKNGGSEGGSGCAVAGSAGRLIGVILILLLFVPREFWLES